VTIHLPPGGSAEYFYGLVSSKERSCEANRAKASSKGFFVD
jgi:hypothetical protein